MPHAVRHWPGGIPNCIKRHPTGDFSSDELIEEVKEWLLFVEETWTPRSDGKSEDGEYELHQRRTLVEQWASASHQFRDVVHSTPELRLKLISAIRFGHKTHRKVQPRIQSIRTDQHRTSRQNTPTHCARFIKFSILLYGFDSETGHCLDSSYMPQVAPLNPASSLTSTFEDFLPWSDLETADFRSIYLTRDGCVLYSGFLGPYILVDEDGLRTGRLSLVQFRPNGTIEDTVQICPFNIRFPSLEATVHMKELQEIRSCEGRRRHQNGPILKAQHGPPLLRRPFQAQAANQLSSGIDLCDRDQWKEDIELYAPGYLAPEEAGRGAEYDLMRLTAPSEITGVEKRVWEKLRTGQVPGFTYLATSGPSQQQQQQPQPQPGPHFGSAPMDIQAMLAELARKHAEGR